MQGKHKSINRDRNQDKACNVGGAARVACPRLLVVIRNMSPASVARHKVDQHSHAMCAALPNTTWF